MKTGNFLAVCFAFLILSLIATPSFSEELILNNVPAKVYFSPLGGCADAICAVINGAKSDILVQAYTFTRGPIAKALAAAHERGVNVQVVLDKSHRKQQATANLLADANIPVYIDDWQGIAHNKIMIIDRGTVITGSFNFTNAAEARNRENLIILSSEDLAKLYTENWKKHKEHSEPYVR